MNFKSLILVLALTQSFFLYAGTVDMVATEWPPYVSKKFKNNGFCTEIIAKAFEQSGHEVKIRYYPWKRALQMAKIGKAHVVFPAYYTEERSREYILSDPFMDSPLVFFGFESDGIKVQDLSKLKDKKIGVVLGYSNGEKIDAATYLKKIEARNETQNFENLVQSKVDLVVGDRFTGLYMLKEKFPRYTKSVIDLKPALSMLKLYLMFNKSSEEAKKFVVDFNKGMKIIKDNGTVEKILKSNGF